jgi:hypothetical protein
VWSLANGVYEDRCTVMGCKALNKTKEAVLFFALKSVHLARNLVSKSVEFFIKTKYCEK